MIIDAQFMIVLDRYITGRDFEYVKIELLCLKINIYLDNCGCSESVTSLTGMSIICEILTFLSKFGVINSRFGATHRMFWR